MAHCLDMAANLEHQRYFSALAGDDVVQRMTDLMVGEANITDSVRSAPEYMLLRAAREPHCEGIDVAGDEKPQEEPEAMPAAQEILAPWTRWDPGSRQWGHGGHWPLLLLLGDSQTRHLAADARSRSPPADQETWEKRLWKRTLAAHRGRDREPTQYQ